VVELRVPEIVEDAFREHYRELVIGSLLRSAEAKTDRHRMRGQTLRARRSERMARRILSAQAAPAAPPVAARRTAAVVWFAILAALIANVVVLGVDSYATAGAVLGLVVMTFVWVAARGHDLAGPGR
jgi:hypothetical protein